MRVVDTESDRFTVECVCGNRFESPRGVLAFECETCGRASYAPDIIGNRARRRGPEGDGGPASHSQ